MKIFFSAIIVLKCIFASNVSSVEEQEAQVPISVLRDKFIELPTLTKIADYLKSSDVGSMKSLSKALNTARIPDNLTSISFINKEFTLPEYLAPGHEDFSFFNRYHPSQLNEEIFFMTIINVCTEGLELNSCRKSARYAAKLYINFESAHNFMDNDSVHKLINANLDKIFELLIKYEDYGTIKELCFLEGIQSKARIHDIINEKKNANLFRNIVLSIERVDEQKSFIASVIDCTYWRVKGIFLAMDLHPSMLIDIDTEMMSISDQRRIILHFKVRNDAVSNTLIYNFKRSVNEIEGGFVSRYDFSKVIEYLYREIPLVNEDNQVDKDDIYVYCAAAVAKRDVDTLIQLLKSELVTNNISYYSKEYSPLRDEALDSILDNLELFKRALPVLHNSHLAHYFNRKAEEFFKNGLPQDENVQNALKVIIDQFWNDPGVYYGLLIFPEILSKDLSSIITFLKANPIYLIETPSELINTFLFIEKKNAIILNFMEVLFETFPEYDLSLVLTFFMEKASFRCIYNLIQIPFFSQKIQNCYFYKLNWKFSDIRRIFQNDLMFRTFYPLRHQIWTAEINSFKVKNILGNFFTQAEVISYLEFFENYLMPKNDSNFKILNAVERNDFIVLFEICEKDTDLALRVMNLASLIYYIPKHHDEVEKVLKKWLYEPYDYERHKFKRVVDLIKNIPFEKKIVIEIDSLNFDTFLPFHSFYFDYDGIRLKYNLVAIMQELEGMTSDDVDEIFRKMSAFPHVYKQMISPYEKMIGKLEEFKRRCCFF